MSRSIERLFGVIARLARALFRRLQTLGKIVKAALNGAFVGPRAFEIVAVQGLLAFANSLRDPITRHAFGRVIQLPRGPLLSAAHRTRRLFDVLLQAAHRISQSILALGQLLARSLRVRVLPTTARKVFYIFGDFTLPRRRLRRTLTQVTDLLLTTRSA